MRPVTRSEPHMVQLVAFSILAPLAMHFIIPAMPLIQRDFQTDIHTVNYLISATLVGIACSTVVFGLFADRFGRRPLLMIGIGFFVLGSLVADFSSSIGGVIFGRVIQGAGGSVGIVIARAVVRDLYDRQEGTSVLAYLSTATIVAPIIAPAIAGLIVENFGWHAVFHLSAAMGLGVLVWLVFTFPETLQHRIDLPSFASVFRAYGGVLKRPTFVAYTLCLSFTITGFFGMMSTTPYLSVHLWHLTPVEYGLWVMTGAMGMMIGTFVTGQVIRDINPDRWMFLGLGLSLAGIAVAVSLFLAGFNDPAALFLPLFLNGLGAGFSMPAATAGGLAVKPGVAGTASGLMTFIQFGMSAIGTQLVSTFAPDSPWPLLRYLLATSLLAIVAGVMAARLMARRQAMGAAE